MLKSILQEVVPKRHRQVLIRQVMLPKKAGVGLQVAGASPGGSVEVAMEIVEFLAIFNRQTMVNPLFRWIIFRGSVRLPGLLKKPRNDFHVSVVLHSMVYYLDVGNHCD